jgi:hypothetical protein
MAMTGEGGVGPEGVNQRISQGVTEVGRELEALADKRLQISRCSA